MLSDNGGASPENSMHGHGAGLEKDTEKHTNWYAAYTMSRHEKRIAEQCQRAGIGHFLPLYAVHKTWKNRVTVELRLPLFPNYIFVRLSPGNQVCVLKLPGVLSIVGSAAGPAPIPSADMDALWQFVRCNTFQPHACVSGDAVRIHRGPLQGLTGVVVRKNNGLRFVVRLDVIGKSVAVDLSANDFEASGPQSMSLTESTSMSA